VYTLCYLQAHLRHACATSASMQQKRWQPTLKGMCINTAAVMAAKGRMPATDRVDCATRNSMQMLVTLTPTMVCVQAEKA
jgi:hypothetical protein